jgi:hypothetical protein
VSAPAGRAVEVSGAPANGTEPAQVDGTGLVREGIRHGIRVGEVVRMRCGTRTIRPHHHVEGHFAPTGRVRLGEHIDVVFIASQSDGSQSTFLLFGQIARGSAPAIPLFS